MSYLPPRKTLPVFGTVRQAYALLWQQRILHAKAIWPPIVFLVTAEFLYHRMTGHAEGLMSKLHAILAAPWYMPAAAAVAWLAGLKFLLSFSISWRRHLLLKERFDPFFFKAPFWRYLGFLLLTYVWVVPSLFLALIPTALVVDPHDLLRSIFTAVALGVPAAAFVGWAIARQVPFFTMLTLDPPHPGWRASTVAMRGTVTRYIGAFILAMLPIAALNLLLDAGLKLAGADPHSVHVALGESAFRQAMLFVHFSLGASIGAITTVTVLPEVRGRLPDAAGRLMT